MSEVEQPQVHVQEMAAQTSSDNLNYVDRKASASKQHEFAPNDIGDVGSDVNANKADSTPVILTEEDDRRIRRATDWAILPVLVWVYFLQSLDKTLLGYAATYGLAKDAGLVGTQYSMIGSISSIAQLCWLPFSSWLMVRVPARTLMMVLVLGWGVAEIGMAFSTSYGALVATRFLLGLFEAACLPLFAVITASWYKRGEQPVRVAIWYSMNGTSNIVAAFMSYGLGQINDSTLYSWQYIFLIGGILTVLTPPLIWWKLDNHISTARFLSPEDRVKGLERLRANQTGVGSSVFNWKQLLEALLEPKLWLWVGMSLTLNVGASVTNVFGPVILEGLPIEKSTVPLMNSVFGFLQFMAVLIACFAAYKWSLKSPVLIACVVPVVVGIALLWALDRSSKNTGPLLLGYYLMAFLYGGNPLIVSWVVANTAGQTKKTVTMVAYNMGSSAGNIIGPLLFDAKDAPLYQPGLAGTLGCFIALCGLIVLQSIMLIFLNRQKSKERVRNGKPAKIVDRSMEKEFRAHDENIQGGEEGEEGTVIAGKNLKDADMTDGKNDEFVYVL